MNKLFTLLAPLVLGCAISAQAAVSYATLGIAGDTNAFIFGNVTATDGGQSQGSFVAGGNFSGTNYDVRLVKGTSTPGSPFPENASLYIGGNDTVAGNKGKDSAVRANSGDIYIGGKYTKDNLLAKKGTIYTKTFDLAPTIENLKQLSADLYNLDSVAITLDPKDKTNVVVHLDKNTIDNGGMKVYTLDSSLLGTGNNIHFEGGKGDETVVVNVVGHTIDWGWSSSYDASKILFNFVDSPSGIKGDTSAQTVNINSMFKGTILAPSANVNQNQNMSGTLIANNLTVNKNSTLMDKAFSGKLSMPLVSAPEPAGVMTMTGFLGLALCSRRRQAARL